MKGIRWTYIMFTYTYVYDINMSGIWVPVGNNCNYFRSLTSLSGKVNENLMK